MPDPKPHAQPEKPPAVASAPPRLTPSEAVTRPSSAVQNVSEAEVGIGNRGWWLVGIGAVVFLVVPMVWPGLRVLARAAWIGLNVFLLLRGFLSLLWHPLAAWNSVGTMLRWAFWPALLEALMIRSFLEPVLAEVTGQWLPSSLVYGFSLVLFLPLLLLASFVWSAFGAAMGSFSSARTLNRATACGRGVRLWWLVTGLVLLITEFLMQASPAGGWVSLGLFGVPLGALAAQRMVGRWDSRSGPERIERWLHRRFVWSRQSGRPMDFRGEALALVAFLLTWGLVSLRLLMPLQASALLQTVQLLGAAYPGRLDIHFDGTSGRTNGWFEGGLPADLVRMEPARASRQVVLLEWDAASLHAATTTNSEPGIHARLIRTLAPLGIRRIVLPTPLLESVVIMANPGGRPIPASGPDDLLRARRDLPQLESAVRDAGNVLLLPPGRSMLDFEGLSEAKALPAGQESFRLLRNAARETAPVRMSPLQIAALPTLSLDSRDPAGPHAALRLAAAVLGSTNLEPRYLGGNRVAVLGREYPVMDSRQQRLLLDFVTATRGGDFPTVTYSSVLRDEPLYDPSSGEHGAWVSRDEFVRDKVVLLHPIRSTPVASPWGSMEPMEQLAYGVRTLVGSFFVHPVPPAVQTLWALACALTVGGLSVRRDPIKSSWRLLLVLVATGALSLLLSVQGLWLDPVFPWIASIGAFLLVTQLTFRMEQTAKERNRFLLDRFVAPEVVDELLEPGAAGFGTGGRRERVTVLFADVRGFTQFAEGHSPEEVMKVVNAYLEVMTEALHRHGGILDKYTGDGLMALFRVERGVTTSEAVRGALAMRDAVLSLSAGRTAGGDKSLKVGISLHVGDAVVGLVGNPERQVNFTALGHTVVVAARLQTQAAGGEVVVSQEVQEAVASGFELSPRPAVTVKGISQPVVPFVVLRERG